MARRITLKPPGDNGSLKPLEYIRALYADMAALPSGYRYIKEELLGVVASVQAQLGEADEAIAQARQLDAPYHRMIALSEVSIGLSKAGQADAAQQALDDARSIKVDTIHSTLRAASLSKNQRF